MTPDEFRANGYQLIDWIAGYLDGIEHLPVNSGVEPGWVGSQLPDHPPHLPEEFEALLGDLDRIVVPALTHWQHPSFFAFFPSNTTYASILGELAAAGLGINAMSWATSPAATEIETVVMNWMRELLGLPAAWVDNGVIQDSASSATLCSILAARDRATSRGAFLERLVGYATSGAHSSIEKGLRIAGIPAERFHVVAHDERYSMDPRALANAVAEDRAAGLVPFWVCASRGTTSSLAFDPVPEIAEMTRAYGLWLHVDGAMSGIAALCPEFRWVNNGLTEVDSYVTNAHKWMGVNFDCSLFWVRDREPLLNALSIQPAFLRTAAHDAGSVIDYRDWQIPLGRRFRALKLWWVLRSEDRGTTQAMIRRHVEWARELGGRMEHDERFELLAPVDLNLVTFALTAGDDATATLVDAVNTSGSAALTRTQLDGRIAGRVSIGNRLTEYRHVMVLWDQLCDLASASSRSTM